MDISTCWMISVLPDLHWLKDFLVFDRRLVNLWQNISVTHYKPWQPTASINHVFNVKSQYDRTGWQNRRKNQAIAVLHLGWQRGSQLTYQSSSAGGQLVLPSQWMCSDGFTCLLKCHWVQICRPVRKSQSLNSQQSNQKSFPLFKCQLYFRINFSSTVICSILHIYSIKIVSAKIPSGNLYFMHMKHDCGWACLPLLPSM